MEEEDHLQSWENLTCESFAANHLITDSRIKAKSSLKKRRTERSKVAKPQKERKL